jgi:hypothetical protein
VVPNPRIAAGSTVVCYWLRLFRCTKDKKHHEDLKNLLTTLDIGSHINAAGERRPTGKNAGNNQKRALWAVRSSGWLDGPWFITSLPQGMNQNM